MTMTEPFMDRSVRTSPCWGLISISLVTVGAAMTRQADTFVYSCGVLSSVALQGCQQIRAA